MAAGHGASPFLVAHLLVRHLRPRLGWRLVPFALALPWALVRVRRKAGRGGDAGVARLRRMFAPIAAVHGLLAARLGEPAAFEATFGFVSDLAEAMQRRWNLPPPGHPRSPEAFIAEHVRHMQHGLIRLNENDGLRRDGARTSFHIVRCRFFEAFRELGLPALTEAFCRSDETVYNEYLPSVRFHRGEVRPDTIARGAPRCTFVFEHGAGTAGDPS